MKLRSIRWRLPATYALIALLATLLLGVVLLTTLHGYYAARELAYLNRGAFALSQLVRDMLKENTPVAAIQAQFEGLSFLSQTRVRLYDQDRHIIADSGVPDNRQFMISSVPVDGPFGSSERAEVTFSPDYASMIFVRSAVRETMPAFDAEVMRAPMMEGATPGSGSSVRGMVYEREEQEHRLPLPMPADSAPSEPIDLGSPGDVLFADFPSEFAPFEAQLGSPRRSAQHVELAIRDDQNGVLGYIELADGPAIGSAIVDGVTRVWLIASAVAVLGAAVVGWFISWSMSRPLLSLTTVTGRMAHGDLSARADVTRDDEFGLLARSFNYMAGRVEETVVTLRRFVADAAHELHTPLTALYANLELATSEDDAAQRTAFLERAQEQVNRLEAMTTGLLDLSRIEMKLVEEARDEIDLVQLLRETGELYATRADQAGIRFQFMLPRAPILARANESQIRRAVCNLLDNAIKFTARGGEICVGAAESQENIELWVQDTGIGIPADDLPYLFSRFHRGRNAAAYPGSGLGLAIIKAIAESHRGDVRVESGDGGTRFSLQLPLAIQT